MGIFGIAEILRNLDHTETREVVKQAIGRLLPNKEDFRQSVAPILRGTFIGAALGILPGNGAVLGPFASYTIEKKLRQGPTPLRPRRHREVAGPDPPTMPAPRPPSSRSSPWESRRTPSWRSWSAP